MLSNYSYEELMYFGSDKERQRLKRQIIENSTMYWHSPRQILEKMNLNEAKKIVKKNNGIVKGDKRTRFVWIYAYVQVVLLAFDEFASYSRLNDDVLHEIQAYL